MKWVADSKVKAGVLAALLLLIGNAAVSYHSTRELIDSERLVSHTYQVLNELEAVLATMTDAETGERGFVITREERYLEPYYSAVARIQAHVETLRRLTIDNPRQQERIPVLRAKIQAHLDQLEKAIATARTGEVESARQLIASGLGKARMDDLRVFIAVMEKDENDLLRYRALAARGNARDAQITLVVANLAASLLVVIVGFVILRDLAARRRAAGVLNEQREWLRVTLSSIGDAVIATDTKGIIAFLNPVAEELIGWRAKEAVGLSIAEVFDIVNEDSRRRVDNPALRAIREGTIVGLANHTILVARDGRNIPIDDSGAPIRDAAGNLVGAVLIFRDITERRQAEREHAKMLSREQSARADAEAANRAKDEFVAMISHEIRSPLTAVMGWGQMLLAGALDQNESRRAVESILLNARAQTKLIEDLMDISRAITGKLRLSVRMLDPIPIIDDAVEAVTPAANAKSIRLEVVRPSTRDFISADPDRLRQIVYNLLTNSVKFTPQDGRIDVVTERVDGSIRISVADSGIGIDGGFLPHVFDRFSQANTSTQRRYSGLGLGLAIVQNLVELHGGRVTAQSAGEGKGATFTVTIPLAPFETA